jgi:hypothetical protein
MTQAITATGLKGFLQWLQQDQPSVYAATAAKIAKAVPRGFSGFNGSALTNMRLSQGKRSMRLRGYGALGCCTASCAAIASVSTCSIAVAPNVCIDTSCAANSGATCASSLTGVANIISSTTSAVLTAQQQAAYNQMLQTQLQRASSGLTPLTVSSTASGLPLISGLTSSSSGTLLLLGGGALLLYLLLG